MWLRLALGVMVSIENAPVESRGRGPNVNQCIDQREILRLPFAMSLLPAWLELRLGKPLSAFS